MKLPQSSDLCLAFSVQVVKDKSNYICPYNTFIPKTIANKFFKIKPKCSFKPIHIGNSLFQPDHIYSSIFLTYMPQEPSKVTRKALREKK